MCARLALTVFEILISKLPLCEQIIFERELRIIFIVVAAVTDDNKHKIFLWPL